MRTEELLRELASRKLVVNRELVEEIVKRQDAPKLISELIDELDEVSDGWFLIHSIFILSIMKTRESFEALKRIVKKYDLGEWMTEDLHHLLANFGFEFFDDIAEIVKDRDYNPWVRYAAYRALFIINKEEGKGREKLVELSKQLFEIIDEGDEVEMDAMCFMLPYMASLHDEELYSIVLKFGKNMRCQEIVSLRELEEIYEHGMEIEKRDPWQHFHPRNLLRLYKINYGNLKFDKYEPCICGSGKKFKYCCWEYWKEVRWSDL